MKVVEEVGSLTIVVGSVGEDPVGGARLGSVAPEIVQRSSTPLLAVSTTEV